MYITYISFCLKLTPAVPSAVCPSLPQSMQVTLSVLHFQHSITFSEMPPVTKLYLIPFCTPTFSFRELRVFQCATLVLPLDYKLYDSTRTTSGLNIVQDHNGHSKELLGLLSGIGTITHLEKCLPWKYPSTFSRTCIKKETIGRKRKKEAKEKRKGWYNDKYLQSQHWGGGNGQIPRDTG